MKKLLFLLAIGLFSLQFATAQRFCYVDTDYILGKMQEYKDAQKDIDLFAEKWQQEVDQRFQEVEKLYKAFQSEQVLLTEDMKRRREDEIIRKEKEAKEFQKQKFGYEGELFKKRQDLIKPIQDKVYEAIQKMATEKSYNFVFDKSSGITMLYADPKLDKSDDILSMLNINSTK